MIKHIITASMLALLALSSPAQAEETAKDTLAYIDGADEEVANLYNVFVSALGTGIQWANVVAHDNGQPIFCPPEKLAITRDQKVQLLRTIVKDNPRLANASAGLALMLAYKETFPCPTKP